MNKDCFCRTPLLGSNYDQYELPRKQPLRALIPSINSNCSFNPLYSFLNHSQVLSVLLVTDSISYSNDFSAVFFIELYGLSNRSGYSKLQTYSKFLKIPFYRCNNQPLVLFFGTMLLIAIHSGRDNFYDKHELVSTKYNLLMSN